MTTPDEIAGMPFLRHGDKVFIVSNAGYDSGLYDTKQKMAQFALMFDEYSCPFSIIHEFEQWWRWHYETIHLKRSTGYVICEMLSDVERIKRHKLERPMMTFQARFEPCFREHMRSLWMNVTA